MMQLEFLFENFLAIFISMAVLLVFFFGTIIKILFSKIGDKVYEFDDNTITEYKAKRRPESTIKYNKRNVGVKHVPYLTKRGLLPSRIYLIEKDESETTDLIGREIGSDGERTSRVASSTDVIIESNIIDKFLSVFGDFGFSISNFLFGLSVGAMIVLFMVVFRVF